MDYQKIFEDEIEMCKKLAGNDVEVLAKIESKREHSLRVVEMGKKILADKEDEWDRETALACLLLHDIGRFEQSLKNSLSDKQTGINHAELGAKKMELIGVDKIIVESIREHNNPYYSGNNIYTHLVREADQLVIMSEWEWQYDWREAGPLSKYAKEKWDKNLIIDSKFCNETKNDWVLMTLSWTKRFQYQATMNIFCEMGMEDKFRAVLGEELNV